MLRWVNFDESQNSVLMFWLDLSLMAKEVSWYRDGELLVRARAVG